MLIDEGNTVRRNPRIGVEELNRRMADVDVVCAK
jgi:hypothetical protein